MHDGRTTLDEWSAFPYRIVEWWPVTQRLSRRQAQPEFPSPPEKPTWGMTKLHGLTWDLNLSSTRIGHVGDPFLTPSHLSDGASNTESVYRSRKYP